jgi:hypothetical protein
MFKPMLDEQQIKQLRKHRRASIRALPVEIGLLAAVCVVLFVVSAFVAVPIWIAATLVGLSAFTVFGDMANIAYISWRLRGIEPPQA